MQCCIEGLINHEGWLLSSWVDVTTAYAAKVVTSGIRVVLAGGMRSARVFGPSLPLPASGSAGGCGRWLAGNYALVKGLFDPLCRG